MFKYTKEMDNFIVQTYLEDALNWEDIAIEFHNQFGYNKTGNALRKRYGRIVDSGRIESCCGNTAEIEVTVEEDCMTDPQGSAFDRLVVETGVDTKVFEVKEGKLWGSPGHYQASLSFQRRQIPPDIDAFIERIKALEFESVPALRVDPYKNLAGIISINDLHLQKLNTDGTGAVQAKTLYRNTLLELMMYLPKTGLEKVLLIVGNDMSNSDNIFGNTTLGTPQRNSVGWQKGIDDVCEMAMWAIQMLSKQVNVEAMIIPGNHDRMSMYWLGKVLEARFRNNQQVTIDNTPGYRKYFQWGKNGLMFVHGDAERKGDYMGLFATEAPKIFAESDYRECQTGHWHTQKKLIQMITEDKGFVIRCMPALTGTDDWHNWKGFVGNNRMGVLTLFDKRVAGQIAEFHSTVQ